MVVRACAVILLVAGLGTPPGREGQPPASPVVRFSAGDFWLNLHQYPYVLGRVEAAMPDISRPAVAGAQGDQSEPRRSAEYISGELTHAMIFFTAGEAMRSIARPMSRTPTRAASGAAASAASSPRSKQPGGPGWPARAHGRPRWPRSSRPCPRHAEAGNTDGGVSDGHLLVRGTALHADEETYRGKNRPVRHFRSVMTPLGETAHEVATQASGGATHERAVAELRSTVGAWDVSTEFLKPNGSVARAARGTYVFDWIVEDRVLRGESTIPDLQLKSGILFFVDQAAGELVMASVGRDGHLWVMRGPAAGDTRTTPDTLMPDGSTQRLRFTRFNVTTDRFESRMEVSGDGGASWHPGNHQVFVRKKTP